MRTVLHVGCGTTPLPPWLNMYEEIRLDIDPANEPDIVADMADLPDDLGPFDLVFACHVLEHLPSDAIEKALKGFLRVLTPGGGVVILVPDLEGLAPTDEVLYEDGCVVQANDGVGTVTIAVPVTAAELFYGLRCGSANPFMAHRWGFVSATLQSALERAGFIRVITKRLAAYNLLGAGARPV